MDVCGTPVDLRRTVLTAKDTAIVQRLIAVAMTANNQAEAA
jgi:hypothetical protein